MWPFFVSSRAHIAALNVSIHCWLFELCVRVHLQRSVLTVQKRDKTLRSTFAPWTCLLIRFIFSSSIWVTTVSFNVKEQRTQIHTSLYTYSIFAAVCLPSVCHLYAEPQALREFNCFQFLQSLQTGFCFPFLSVLPSALSCPVFLCE